MKKEKYQRERLVTTISLQHKFPQPSICYPLPRAPFDPWGTRICWHLSFGHNKLPICPVVQLRLQIIFPCGPISLMCYSLPYLHRHFTRSRVTLPVTLLPLIPETPCLLPHLISVAEKKTYARSFCANVVAKPLLLMLVNEAIKWFSCCVFPISLVSFFF